MTDSRRHDPRTRAEANGTRFEPLWETPPHWPDDVRMMSNDALGLLGLDPENRLHWDGEPVVTRRTVALEGPTFWVAVVATSATVVAAVWPILVHVLLS